MTIFTPQQLREWLRYDEQDVFVEGTAVLVEKVVAGWLSAEVGPISDQVDETSPLFGWALELGGIAYENPTSMSDDSSGETRSSWANRKVEILRSARAWAEVHGTAPSVASTTPQPRGKFPPAPAWPESYTARRRGCW